MNRKLYIRGYTYRFNEGIEINHKPVIIKTHAILRARERHIAFPDQVYNAICTGKLSRFAKNGIKIISRNKYGTIICIGEDLGHTIIIKTIERGN